MLRFANAASVYWFSVAVAALAVAFAPLPYTLEPPAARVLRVDARQYAYSPSELRVNVGDTVTLQLVSTDVVHGLYVDGYGVSLQADPGQSSTLSFVANRPGSFRFRCNVTCGALHPFMIGRLTVGGNRALDRALGLTVIALLGGMLAPRKSPDIGLGV